ncbi:hypothetical protein JVU11DRAFT_8848 [Chiua virens]|nr:hypothetical protein JVU11DRAFT_8848 [Chiua virens]
MSSNQGIPPLASGGVLVVSASIVIDAPRDTVWRNLMDWGSYHECRNQRLTDASKVPLPVSEQTPRVGSHMLIHPVHIPPSLDPPKLLPASSAFVVITALDSDNYRCAWETVNFPTWLLHSVRWQALVEVLEDGRKKTRYETIEVFNGLLAYVIKLLVAGGLRKGFVAMAEGLKKRSEERHTA